MSARVCDKPLNGRVQGVVPCRCLTLGGAVTWLLVAGAFVLDLLAAWALNDWPGRRG